MKLFYLKVTIQGIINEVCLALVQMGQLEWVKSLREQTNWVSSTFCGAGAGLISNVGE